MRLAPLVLAFAAALAVAAPAAAKGLVKLEVCGPSGCQVVTAFKGDHDPPIYGAATGLRPAPSSFYVLRADRGGVLSIEAPTARTPAVSDWIAIDLRASRPSPWTYGMRDLVYSPSANVLERGMAQLALPGDLAAEVEAAFVAEESGRRLPWLVLSGVAAAVLLLAGLGALLRRRLDLALPEPAA